MARGLLGAASLLVLYAVAAQASQITQDVSGRSLLQSPRQPDCTRISGCGECHLQRVPGKRTELLCDTCQTGWVLRKDGTSKTCDCAAGRGFVYGNICTACPAGKYCPGGSAQNPGNLAFDCPAGLTTTFQGAKSQDQCFTKPGFGRVSARGADGRVTVSAVVCDFATYNQGGNTLACQKCGLGLTTASRGSSSPAQCSAPAGSYVEKATGAGRLCPKGSYSTGLNPTHNCSTCPAGSTTASEGSTSVAACNVKTNNVN